MKELLLLTGGMLGIAIGLYVGGCLVAFAISLLTWGFKSAWRDLAKLRQAPEKAGE